MVSIPHRDPHEQKSPCRPWTGCYPEDADKKIELRTSSKITLKQQRFRKDAPGTVKKREGWAKIFYTHYREVLKKELVLTLP